MLIEFLEINKKKISRMRLMKHSKAYSRKKWNNSIIREALSFSYSSFSS